MCLPANFVVAMVTSIFSVIVTATGEKNTQGEYDMIKICINLDLLDISSCIRMLLSYVVCVFFCNTRLLVYKGPQSWKNVHNG